MGGVSRAWFRRDLLLSRFYTTAVLFCTLRTIILLLVVGLGATLPAAAHAPIPSALIVTRAAVLRTQLTKNLETTTPARLASTQVPPGTEIGSSQVFWETYRWQVTGLGGIFLLQAIIIWALLLQRHRRRAAQFEACGRRLEVIRLSRAARVGASSASIADELNQPLASIMSNAEAAEILLAMSPPDTSQVKEILAEIRQADERAADLTQQLRKLLTQQTKAELQYFDVFSDVLDRSYTTEHGTPTISSRSRARV